MSKLNQVEFYVTMQHGNGTHYARCCGCVASSTQGPEVAATSAANKYWKKCTPVHGGNLDQYTVSARAAVSSGAIYSVVYTLKSI